MTPKPITPGLHGLIDYSFAAALINVPKLLGCDKQTVFLYRVIGAQVFLYSAVTRQPLGIIPLISMKTHQKVDVGNLLGLALFTAYKGVRHNHKALIFNLGMVALGLTSVLLTHWDSNK
jgi:hypothetical protein